MSSSVNPVTSPHVEHLHTPEKPRMLDRSELANLGFIDPGGSQSDAVRQLLHDVLKLALDRLNQADQFPTVPRNWQPIRAAELIPDVPSTHSDLLAAAGTLLNGSMNPAHPRYFGHMDPLASSGSIAAAIISAAVNNNLLSREMSPIFSDLEDRLLAQLAGLFGLPETAGGIMQSGGTLCNLQALTVARNQHFPVREKGLFGLKKRPVLLASQACHTSIQKSAMLLGLGTEAVVPVATDNHGKICPQALHDAIRNTLADNAEPFAIVATAGTTVTGNIDPLPEIADLAQRFGLWLHVDASYGGAMIFSPSRRGRLNGIERADSVTFNPQKWCYVTKACALVLFRDRELLNEHFRIPAPYMSLNEADGATNLGEWGIQGTRAPDIAKWWLTLLQFGQSGLGQLIDHSFEQTELFIEQIQKRDFLELATPPEMNIVCFRDLRAGKDPAQLAEHNSHLQQHLLDKAGTFFSLPHYRNSRWLKAVLLNPFTTKQDFQDVFEAIDKFEVV